MRVPVQSAAIRRTGYTSGAMAPASAGVAALAAESRLRYDEHLIGFPLQDAKYPCVCPGLNCITYVDYGKSCKPDPQHPLQCIQA